MVKYNGSFRLNIIVGIWAFFLVLFGCKPEDEEVMPHQTCDIQATIRNLPECGLALVLKNKQTLVPVNAQSLPATLNGKNQFKINGFTVEEGQQVIIGFSDKGKITNTCLKDAALVQITCIVGYKVQS